MQLLLCLGAVDVEVFVSNTKLCAPGLIVELSQETQNAHMNPNSRKGRLTLSVWFKPETKSRAKFRLQFAEVLIALQPLP